MKIRRFTGIAFLVSIALLALLVLGEEWSTAAPSPQTVTCNSSFTFVRKWGSTGSGPGQFQAPVAVAVDWHGDVHVVDRDNRRIQKFNAQNDYSYELEYGNEDGRVMINPNGIEVGPRGHLYIADTDQHRILYYGDSGAIIGGWKDGDSSEWRLLKPWGVAAWDYNYDGNVYVVDGQTCNVLRFLGNGQFVDDWGHCDPAPYLPYLPQDVAVYPSRGSPPSSLYIADTGNHRVMKFDYRLTWLFNWGTAGAGDGQFNQPSSIATDADGCVYVADTGNHRIQVFNDQGVFQAKFGSQGSGQGQFQSPRGVALDSDGCVYVADTGNNRIQVFCPPVTTPVVGTIPPGGGSLTSPADRTTYTFAPGTFPSTVVITHTPRLAGGIPSPGNLTGIGHFFDVSAVYSDTGQPAYPSQPYTVKVQYTETEQGPAIENTLALYSWNGSRWEEEPISVVDTVNNILTATPDHFSLWAVLGETRRVYLPIVLRNH